MNRRISQTQNIDASCLKIRLSHITIVDKTLNLKKITMTLLLGMPGGSEWIVIIFILIFLLIMPILAIIFYVRNKRLSKQIKELIEENNSLLTKLLDQK